MHLAIGVVSDSVSALTILLAAPAVASEERTGRSSALASVAGGKSQVQQNQRGALVQIGILFAFPV